MIVLISLTASGELPCQKLPRSQHKLYHPTFHFPPYWQPGKCSLIWEGELILPVLLAICDSSWDLSKQVSNMLLETLKPAKYMVKFKCISTPDDVNEI